MHSGAPGFRLFMEEQEEAGGWQRAVVALDLLKNCPWVRKLDRETEMGVRSDSGRGGKEEPELVW